MKRTHTTTHNDGWTTTVEWQEIRISDSVDQNDRAVPIGSLKTTSVKPGCEPVKVTHEGNCPDMLIARIDAGEFDPIAWTIEIPW